MGDLGDPAAEAAIDLLRERGPLGPEEWAALMVERGIAGPVEAEDIAEYIDHPLIGYLPDMRAFAVDALLEGRILTHRLTAAEIAGDVLDAGLDVSPLMDLADSTENVGVVTSAFDELVGDRGIADPTWPVDLGLVLERGTLTGLRPGDLFGLRVAGGQLRPERVDTEAHHPGLAQILTAALPPDEASLFDSVVWLAGTDDPALFRTPTQPLSEAVEEAGFARRQDYVAPAGFDFEADERAMLANMATQLFHIDYATASTLVEITGLQKHPAEELPGAIAEVLTANPSAFDKLDEFELAPALCRQLDLEATLVSSGADRLLPIVEELARRVPRRARAGAHHLAGLLALRLGRGTDAEAHFCKAVELDDSWTPAYRELAGLAAVRGEYAVALSMFDRMVFSDREVDSLYGMLVDIAGAQADAPQLGRNDRCWCGSGRKHKVCHLGKPMLDARQQASLILDKAMELLRTSEFLPLLMELAEVRAEHHPEAARTGEIADGFVFDVLLFEGRVLAAFLKRFSDLIPVEEQLTAAQWILSGRSVYEVEAVQPGVGLTARDLRTGDRHEVAEVAGSSQLRPGMFVCTRLVPVGEEWLSYGGIEPVEQSQREELIDLLDDDPDPADLIELLSRRLAPPRVVTDGGADLVFCNARFAVADAKGIRRKLSRRYGKGERDSWAWLEGTSVKGHLDLETGPDGGLELVVAASSERRFDALLLAVAEMDPAGRLLEETREPLDIANLGAAGPRDGQPTGHPLGLPAPEDRHDSFGNREPLGGAVEVEVLDGFIRLYEDTWLDESIPALGGRSPREVAADPTRRDDLIRLLDSFPQAETPGMMSVARLRAALGL